MLVHRRELRINLCFYMFRGHNHDRRPLLFLAVDLLQKHLVILLKPHVLVEPGESLRQPEGVLHALLVLELSVHSAEIVIL